MTYKIGSIIEYKAFGDTKRKVKVTEKCEAIKNGQPGFSGNCLSSDNIKSFESNLLRVWGYNSQITKVIKY